MERLFRVQQHLWICIGLAVLNMADALFTHRVLMKGGTELNPLMRSLYTVDPFLFLGVKFLFSYIIIAVGFVSLKSRVRILLVMAFIIYLLVFMWHLIVNLFLINK